DFEGTRTQEYLKVTLPTEITGDGRIPLIKFSQTYTTGWSTMPHSLGMKIDPPTCWAMAPYEVRVNSLDGSREGTGQERYAAGKNVALTKSTRMLKLNRLTVAEYAAAVLACTAGSYAGTNKLTLSGTNQWSNPNSDIIGIVEDAKKAVHIYSGSQANRMVINRDCMYALKTHTKLRELKRNIMVGTKGSMDFSLDESELSDVFGLDLKVADAQYETGALGLTSSKAQIWGNFAWIGYVNPNPTPNMVEYSFGYNFWRTPMGASSKVNMRLTDPDQHSHSGQTQTLYVDEEYDQMLVSTTAGYLITAPIA
ncbi:MAG: hypothetical protein NTV01_01780, partial [Bacteroidia bacterium]|nr:hypothetical protein [Bacteroidia bacterium]